MNRFATTLKMTRWLQLSLLAVVLVALGVTAYLAYDRFIAHPDEYPTHHLRYALPSKWVVKDPSPWLSAVNSSTQVPVMWQAQHLIEVDSPHSGEVGCCTIVSNDSIFIADYFANHKPNLSAWITAYMAYFHDEASSALFYKSDNIGGQPALCSQAQMKNHFNRKVCLILWDGRVYLIEYYLGPPTPTNKTDGDQLNAFMKSLQFV